LTANLTLLAGANPAWNEELTFDVTNRDDITIWVYNGVGKV
jgi:hypothetical protein